MRPEHCPSLLLQTGIRRLAARAPLAAIVISLGLTSGAAVFAQTGSSQSLPEITVRAPRPPTPEELAGHAVPDFIRAHAAPAAVTGQLARWGVGRDAGICPLTQGLSPGLDDFVSARVLAVAGTVGAPVQTGGCKHNVYIVFATDPQKALLEMVRQNEQILGYHYPVKANDLEKISRPIQGWYVTTSHGAGGDESTDRAVSMLPQGDPLTNYAGQYPAGRAGSRFTSEISTGIVNVLIVADAKKVFGRTIGSIADYIAVLTLTRAFATEQCGALPSITDLFLPNCHGDEELTGITAGDLAFLKALYQADLESYLPLERSDIQSNMMRQFQRH